MEMRKRQPIGIELVKRGIISEEDIKAALDYQRSHPNDKIGDILYKLKICDPQKLIKEIGNIVGDKGILLTQNDIRVPIDEYMSLDLAKKYKAIINAK